jgi:hypothetical protein
MGTVRWAMTLNVLGTVVSACRVAGRAFDRGVIAATKFRL